MMQIDIATDGFPEEFITCELGAILAKRPRPKTNHWTEGLQQFFSKLDALYCDGQAKVWERIMHDPSKLIC